MLQNGSFTRLNGADPTTAKVWPQFFTDTVLDEAASASAGRAIYREEERVKIIMPGNALNIPVFKVSQEHIERWPELYKAFKENREPSLDGTPIEEWPILNKAMIAELKHLNIRTIEQMAEVPDNVLQRMGMGGMTLRDRARAFLDDSERLALTESQAKVIDQLTTANGDLAARVDTLSALVDRLHSDLQSMRDAPSAVATHIPGMADPVQQASQAAPKAPPAPSALDSLAQPRRRGRQSNSEKGAA